ANNNTFQNNNFFYECNVFYANYSNWKIKGNKVINNTITGKNGGYMFCMLLEEFESAEITNNLVANNIGEDGIYGIVGSSFNSTATNCDVHQNTIYLDGTTITSGAYDINGLFLTPYFQADISVSGNIIALKEGNSGSIIGVDAASSGAVKLMDNNSYHILNVASQTWFLPGVGVSDFANWILLTGVGAGESFINPKFTNIGNNDFKPKQWQLQNNVTTLSFNLTDIDGNPRNSKRSDRGAYEQIADVKAVSSPFSINAKVCSGLQKKVSIKIQNLYVDTVTNFNVSYSVGNSTKTSQKVTKKLAPNDTTTITFTTPMSLNQWGSVKINIFVDVPDDNTSNDTLKFSTFLDPAPGGGKLTPGAQPTKAIYSSNSNPDVIVVGEPLYYYLSAPRAYANVDYGTKWTATAWAVTVPGNTSISGWTYYSPISTSDQYVKFLTSNSNLEDSLIKVCIKVTDIANGCDTTNCRMAKIAPIPVAAFTGPSIVCGNDTAHFTNKSSIKSGGMRYHWNFGTGKAADTSDKSDPDFNYLATGTYKVKLTVYSQPYGYTKSDSANVTVSQKPKASFTKTNACERENSTFTNQTTPTGGTNKWVITGYPAATTKDLIVKFNAPGQYNVTLYTTYNGCIDSITQKAFQFNTPVADFSAPAGQCSNSVIQFTNKGKLTSGTFASYWNFGNGQTSKTFEPSHTFGTLGSASVKLLLISDLGCKDSVTKTLSLKQSPAIDFLHSEACSIDSTTFKNQTPPVPATTPSFKWSFGDGTTATAENPYHFWKTIGDKNVKLIISLSNGCKDSLSKLLTVKTQPKVAFTDNSPVCYGSKVNFNNGTTWAQGSVNYDWNFGDASNSDKSDPSYQYLTNLTKTYNVTLCADVNGACKTCFVKPVTVNALPGTCDFEASPDYGFGYYGMKCIPKNTSTGALGQQFGVTYKWNFENSGFQTQDTGRYNFQTDGSYSVTMCAEFGSTSCSCCVTKQVRMDRTPIAAFKHENVRIYPNPNAGKFQIELPESQLPYTVSLYDMGGKLVYKTQLQGNTAEINSKGFGAGIYLLKAESGQNSYRGMVEITD
ncbi:MAG: PKD domain-containing protein, partial [Bacteroidia bacterium]|nr:PKD domain-containing protein [Bacteroidia bacterium]